MPATPCWRIVRASCRGVRDAMRAHARPRRGCRPARSGPASGRPLSRRPLFRRQYRRRSASGDRRGDQHGDASGRAAVSAFWSRGKTAGHQPAEIGSRYAAEWDNLFAPRIRASSLFAMLAMSRGGRPGAAADEKLPRPADRWRSSEAQTNRPTPRFEVASCRTTSATRHCHGPCLRPPPVLPMS